tara:strand:- start:450 stop:2177 length:1728 start_codon:yes stop_codon:yes gene_type:complete
MFKNNFTAIGQIISQSSKSKLKFYFVGSIFLALLETVGIGIVPGYLSLLLDKNLILDKIQFNETLYNLSLKLLSKDSLILILSISLFSFFLIKSLLIMIFYKYESEIFKDLKVGISSNLFSIYLNKNYLFHAANDPIILGRNISSEVNTSVAYIKSVLIILKEIIQISLIALLLLFASFQNTLVIFGILGLISFLYLKIFSKKLKEKADISFYERGIKSKIINQILNAIIEIKLYKKSKFFIHKFKNSIDREFQSIKFFEIINKIPKLVIEITIILIICISIILSDYNGVDIQSIIPIIVLYFVAALRVYPSINNILLHRLALINGSISISKVCEEFKNANHFSEKNVDDLKETQFKKSIQLSNISFKYPGREKLLENMSLGINKNEIIGIVGKTGSGKSTLVKIIMGLIKPENGKVLIDNENLENIKNSWQNEIGYIPQNFYILDDTILENIVFGEENKYINHDKINKIIKTTLLKDLIDELPKGLNTIVGPNGKKISGGQAQRLAIARALYQETSLMVFDEATNSLDQNTENEIMNYIYSLKDKTVIIITHNENILYKCSRVFKIIDKKIEPN